MKNKFVCKHIIYYTYLKMTTIQQLDEIENKINYFQNERIVLIKEQQSIGSSTNSRWQKLDERIFEINDIISQLTKESWKISDKLVKKN